MVLEELQIITKLLTYVSSPFIIPLQSLEKTTQSSEKAQCQKKKGTETHGKAIELLTDSG